MRTSSRLPVISLLQIKKPRFNTGSWLSVKLAKTTLTHHQHSGQRQRGLSKAPGMTLTCLFNFFFFLGSARGGNRPPCQTPSCPREGQGLTQGHTRKDRKQNHVFGLLALAWSHFTRSPQTFTDLPPSMHTVPIKLVFLAWPKSSSPSPTTLHPVADLPPSCLVPNPKCPFHIRTLPSPSPFSIGVGLSQPPHLLLPTPLPPAL